jgi:hypothetical protein
MGDFLVSLFCFVDALLCCGVLCFVLGLGSLGAQVLF